MGSVWARLSKTESGLNIARIACEQSVKSCDVQQSNMLTQMNKIYMTKSKDLDDDQWNINFRNELIDVGHQTAESGRSPEEAEEIL